MNFAEMEVSALETRLAAIGEEINADDADLDALEQETRDIKAELEKRKAAEAQRNEIREAVAAGDGEAHGLHGIAGAGAGGAVAAGMNKALAVTLKG